MKNNIIELIMIIIFFIVIASLWGIPQINSFTDYAHPERYSYFCDVNIPVKWNLVIYMDINACIACTEDMNLWKELEETLTETQGRFTLYSNDEDSMDVAIAMELEGIKSPVYVIENSMIDSLGWKDKETPIKLLLDKDCNIITTFEVSNNKEQYKLMMKNLIDLILKNEYKQ